MEPVDEEYEAWKEEADRRNAIGEEAKRRGLLVGKLVKPTRLNPDGSLADEAKPVDPPQKTP